MRVAGEENYYPATVPGSVYQDLLDQGRMEDPYYRDNEDAALEIMLSIGRSFRSTGKTEKRLMK